MEEKLLTINLRKGLAKTAKWEKAKDYMRILRQQLKKIMKTDKIRIDNKVNERVWSRGIEKPPFKLRIKTIKSDDGSVKVELA